MSESVHPQFRYLREPVPIHFPSAEEMPETAVHVRLRTALFLMLEERLKGQAFIGSDQFVYWDPTDPRRCLAPDAFVRLGGPLTYPSSFKTWQHGAPHVAVEVISYNDGRDTNRKDKLERYRQCGVAEVAFFDPEDDERTLRLWDLVEGDLVERDLSAPNATFCKALGAYWVVEAHADFRFLLRLAGNATGSDPWLTPSELRDRECAAKEAERSAKEAERSAKEAALARVAELEAELARRR